MIGRTRFTKINRAMIPAIVGVIACLLLLGGMGFWAVRTSEEEHLIGSYATGLRGRTPSQVHNLTLAARRIDGLMLQPGATFSFTKAVGPWTADMGYKKAPVSYDGELIRSWGGGVCQTSTTLYNAALMAGLKIVERHPHHWPARYAPVGRDAAVAYSSIDLKFTNNLPRAVRISGKVKDDKMTFHLYSAAKPEYRVHVHTQAVSVTKPGQILLPNATGRGRLKLVSKGHPGFHVITYRDFEYPDKVRREQISDDQYPVMDRVVQLVDK